MFNNRIQILDCTLRDGGLGLEDAYNTKIADVGFTEEDKTKIALNLKDSNIDIIELGSIEVSNDNKTRFAIYHDIESVSKMIPANRKTDQMYVGLFRGPDTPLENIPDWNPDLVDGLRVIIRYSELKKSIDFCSGLASKGYKVFVQPMLTMRYTNDEILYLIKEANKMQAYALYFVDSYGYMDDKDVANLFEKYDRDLDTSIRIGFHSHNNMNLAYSNVLSFIKNSGNRKIIVDACTLGMGQGAGNLQTELIISYLNESNSNLYNFNALLDVCEIVESYCVDNLWGYSVVRLLPAIHKTAYKYSVSLRKHYKLTYRQINNILNNIPEDLKHRYTVENTEKLLQINGLS